MLKLIYFLHFLASSYEFGMSLDASVDSIVPMPEKALLTNISTLLVESGNQVSAEIDLRK